MVFIRAVLYCAVVMATLYLTSASADENPRESRGFFSLFPSIVACNFTEQSGSTCLSCNQSLYCFQNNVCLLWNCGGLLPNCHEGHCSTIRPDNCTSS
ncbi:uncharacterized protein LOC106142223 isoform X1 [Amyelois transitella]|uniref:uncharacterized protein LOC106142223 isoform X1 n=1 Tax=Amyelois transitella TaxID=680683 RepID=UPI0029907485|nr:uncharacterized protein LOC106142223 isoform X1 [Amyelois transitella]